MRPLRVGIFTEVYRPIRNGVVGSVETLLHELTKRGVDATCSAPWYPGSDAGGPRVRRLASLPLPTRTGYRLVLPYAPIDRTRTILHAHSPFVTGELARRAARVAAIPLVFTYHTRLEAYAHYAPLAAGVARAGLRALARRYANAADVVVVPTHAIARDLRGIGVRSRIEVVPTGIDVAAFAGAAREREMRARLGAAGDASLVLCVGRLAREKNVPLALAAFAALRDPHARLALVGEGPERGRFEAHARELGIAARVCFAGAIDSARMAAVYAAGDALLFSSTTETQGLVICEALAAALPIVAVATPVTTELLAANARIVAADPRALAAALADVLAGRRPAPPPRAALARLDRRAMTDRLLEIYASAEVTDH